MLAGSCGVTIIPWCAQSTTVPPLSDFPSHTPPTLPTLFQRQSADDKHDHTNNFVHFLTRLPFVLLTEGFLDFLCLHFSQHCFICRPSDSAVSEDAGIEPRTVVILALTFTRSSHSATSHPSFCFSYSLSLTFSVCLGIATRLCTPPP
jgi:hypothetical protein